jgi:hypothetical protein
MLDISNNIVVKNIRHFAAIIPKTFYDILRARGNR